MKPTRRDRVAFMRLFDLAEQFHLLEPGRFEPTGFNDTDRRRMKAFYSECLETPGVRTLYYELKTYAELVMRWTNHIPTTPEEYAAENDLDVEIEQHASHGTAAIVRFGGSKLNIDALRRRRPEDIES